MDDVCDEFQFIKIDNVCEAMVSNGFFAVVDIKAAYRSVNVNPAHRIYHGLVSDVNGHSSYLLDYCLSFGLKCAPWIFWII